MELLSDTRLREEKDGREWRLTKNGKFSVNSFYGSLRLRECSVHHRVAKKVRCIWRKKIPSNVIFLLVCVLEEDLDH